MTDNALSKQDREREARIQAVAKRGDQRPPSTDLSAILGTDPPPAHAASPAAAEPAPAKPHVKRAARKAKAAASELQVLVDPAMLEKAAGGRRLRRAEAKPPAAAEPAAAAPAAPAPPQAFTAVVNVSPGELVEIERNRERALLAEAGAPWAAAHPKMITPRQVRMPEELFMKLQYLAERMPSTSMHKLMLDAIEQHVAEILPQYYQPAK